MPAVQKEVNHRKASSRGRNSRGQGISTRGRGGTRGTLKEIKESIAGNKPKTEPLSSKPDVLYEGETVYDGETEDDTDANKDKEEDKIPEQKENAPEVRRKNQTAKRGKPFARSSGAPIRKIDVTDCSINLSNDCVGEKCASSSSKKKPKKAKTDKKIKQRKMWMEKLHKKKKKNKMRSETRI